MAIDKDKIKFDSSSIIIRLSDLRYPCGFPELRGDNPNVTFSPSFLATELPQFGYAYVIKTPKPQGDVAYEVDPELDEDGWYNQVWAVRDYTPEELASILYDAKIMAAYQVDTLVEMAREEGIPVTLTVDGVPSAQRVRMRQSDQTVYNTALQVALSAEDTEEFSFVMINEILVTLPRPAYLVEMNEINKQFYKMIKKSWVLRDAISKATTLAELPAIPPTLL